MSNDELTKLSEECAKVSEGLDRIGDDKHQTASILIRVFYHMGRIVSHVQSEQRVAQDLRNRVNEHDLAIYGDRSNPEESEGMVHSMKNMKDFMAFNRKLHWLVTSGVIALLVKAFWDLLLHK